MNKKGNLDLVWIILILFVAVIILIFSGFFFNKFKTEIEDEGAFQDNETQNALEKTSTTMSNLDLTIFFVFIGFIIFLIVSSYLIRTNPIFVVIMVIILILITLMAMIFSNVYQGIVEGDLEIQEFVESDYPITNFIFYNLPFLVFIVDIFSLIALFAKGGGDRQ